MISREEWARLQSAALGDKNPVGPINDRKERHERSKAIVKNWENTIEVNLWLLTIANNLYIVSSLTRASA